MKRLITRILLIVINLAIRLYKKFNKRNYKPRLWSNTELKKIAHLFSGNIINVSAGADRDKENEFYRNYFQNKTSYSISNYKKIDKNENYNEIILDLEQKISPNLVNKFDVVFTHTVLEHVYDMDTAIENLCNLSKDIIITIVPFLQTYHHDEEIYNDFWRFSPLALIKKFNEQKFKTVFINWNKDPLGNIYLFHVATCKPEYWGSLEELNKVNLKQYAPGFQRHQLQSQLNMKTDRILIKTIEQFLIMD